MRQAEENRREEIVSMINGMKYEFATQEAFFLTRKLANLRLHAHVRTIKLLDSRLDEDLENKEVLRIQEQVEMIRTLCADIHFCQELRKNDRETYLDERKTAFRSAQTMNFALFAVDRTLQQFEYRPEKMKKIEDTTLRYLNSPDAHIDGEFQIRYMQNHLKSRRRMQVMQMVYATKDWLKSIFI